MLRFMTTRTTRKVEVPLLNYFQRSIPPANRRTYHFPLQNSGKSSGFVRCWLILLNAASSSGVKKAAYCGEEKESGKKKKKS